MPGVGPATWGQSRVRKETYRLIWKTTLTMLTYCFSHKNHVFNDDGTTWLWGCTNGVYYMIWYLRKSVSKHISTSCLCNRLAKYVTAHFDFIYCVSTKPLGKDLTLLWIIFDALFHFNVSLLSWSTCCIRTIYLNYLSDPGKYNHFMIMCERTEDEN